ncbi:MAG TPA: EAL domain-containing protein [Burkholderiales bacterium]|nr:EAL domain-containing protein [Burkholderiales bacterium]
MGFEALARWRHPTQGLLTPGAFTAAFDDPELSIAFGEYMVRRVAEDISPAPRAAAISTGPGARKPRRTSISASTGSRASPSAT